MKNKLTYRLLVIFSLFFLAFCPQAMAADKTVQTMQNTAPAAEKININTATIQQLATIKGIGDKKAQAIIEYREMHGDFSDLNGLVNVKGIGEGTLKKIEPFVTL